MGLRRLLEGEETLLKDMMGSSFQHLDSLIPMFPQRLTPSASASKALTDAQVGGGQAKCPRSSGARRWAWCSSSCKWRLPTAAWLSLGSWVWSSSEMWVGPSRHIELWEVCPGLCLSFLQSTWGRSTCRVVKKPVERVRLPQSWSESQSPCWDPTCSWVPFQCSAHSMHNLRTIPSNPKKVESLHESPSMTDSCCHRKAGWKWAW